MDNPTDMPTSVFSDAPPVSLQRAVDISAHVNSESPKGPQLTQGATWAELETWLLWAEDWADDMVELCSLYTEGDLWTMVAELSCTP